jgi:prepilin-type processing-associated H-X9-DG protein
MQLAVDLGLENRDNANAAYLIIPKNPELFLCPGDATGGRKVGNFTAGSICPRGNDVRWTDYYQLANSSYGFDSYMSYGTYGMNYMLGGVCPVLQMKPNRVKDPSNVISIGDSRADMNEQPWRLIHVNDGDTALTGRRSQSGNYGHLDGHVSRVSYDEAKLAYRYVRTGNNYRDTSNIFATGFKAYASDWPTRRPGTC